MNTSDVNPTATDFAEADAATQNAIDEQALAFVNTLAAAHSLAFSSALVMAMDSLITNAAVGGGEREDATAAYLRCAIHRVSLSPTAQAAARERISRQHTAATVRLCSAIDNSIRAARAKMERNPQ